jgi:hypothetical protein
MGQGGKVRGHQAGLSREFQIRVFPNVRSANGGDDRY